MPKLILLLGTSFDNVIKVMKPLYSIPKAGNHSFTTYYTYHKDKFKMKKSIYNPCFLYGLSLFCIMRIQIDDTLILANNDFASIEEDVIRSAKIITKDRKHFTSVHPLKFNGTQIKLDLNKKILTKKSYV